MLNPTGQKIHKMKYSKNGETWEQTCFRVADYVASAETVSSDRYKYLREFYNLIYNLCFIPGGRVLANSGTGIKNLNNCFVLPVEDSRYSIYSALRDAAEIFANGGGLGYDFSKIREEGAEIGTTGGKASGPLSFMSLFDQTGEVIQQASRRGAQLAMLSVDHPDIEKYIDFKSKPNTKNTRLIGEYKRNLKKVGLNADGHKYFRVLEKTLLDDQLTHFNISVSIPDAFMESYEGNGEWKLTSRNSENFSISSSCDLLKKLANQCYESGDPGVFFVDRVNKDNMVKYLGKLETTNPCLTGDTKILTLDGIKTFKELADKGDDVLVYSWNPKTKLPSIQWMRNPRITQKDVELVEIEFDSGLKVKCTPNHNFYSFRGEKIQAQNLSVGQSVRAFSISEHRDGHLRAHGWKDNKTNHQYVSRMLWECYYGKIPSGMVVHHINNNEKDNRIENLEIITSIEHNKKHYQKRLENGFFHKESYAHAMSRNHKVISIKKLEQREDVYNGTVDETHTYIIADDGNISGIFSGIVSANCGEVPLLPYEACCLGSINLKCIVDEEGKLNLEFLEYIVRTAVRFLDNVQTLSETSIENVNYWCKGLRRLGLGIMGWADLLAELEVPYNSPDAFELARFLSWFISFFGWLESIELAEERGAFPFYDKELVDLHVVEKSIHGQFQPNKFDMEQIREGGVRNVAVTSIAPTGTIALLAGVNSSIEPFFALSYRRNITEGVGNTATDYVYELNPILEKKLRKYGFSDTDIKEILAEVKKSGSIQNIEKIPEKLRGAFTTANEIEWHDHITMQSCWQEFIDNSISKTINMPENSTVEDIENAFYFMWKMGLKGGTIYRDNSKMFQILERGK